MRQIPALKTSSSLLIAFVALCLCSCTATRSFTSSTYEARDATRKSFVEKKDGTVIEADEAKLRTPLFGKSTITLDGDQKIQTKEIVAYQNNTAYHRKVNSQFATRIKKGLINMYTTTNTVQQYETGVSGGMGRMRTRTVITYHLQKGDSAMIETFYPAVTRRYVQDYAPAMEYIELYDANRRKAKLWSVLNTAAVFGGALLVMTNGLKDDKLTGAGYGGLALSAGGIVNGFVNKFRKARNFSNLELAIDTYNGQVIKKKRKP